MAQDETDLEGIFLSGKTNNSSSSSNSSLDNIFLSSGDSNSTRRSDNTRVCTNAKTKETRTTTFAKDSNITRAVNEGVNNVENEKDISKD